MHLKVLRVDDLVLNEREKLPLSLNVGVAFGLSRVDAIYESHDARRRGLNEVVIASILGRVFQ